MQIRKDGSSPWGKRIHFEEPEFELMMDDLRFRTSGECFTSGKGVDVERVLMKGVGVEADYVDLPDGVMGRTMFNPDGSVIIEVSRELSEAAEGDAASRRRLRTTLAHECGHFACHGALFVHDVDTLSLFDNHGAEKLEKKPPIMCRHAGAAAGRYSGEWWEFQANQCMASLLTPRKLFGAATRRVLKTLAVTSFEEAIVAGHGQIALRTLADEFDVSKQATLIRLQTLGFVPIGPQSKLDLVDMQ